MTIEMTAGQAQIALEAFSNELWQLEKQSIHLLVAPDEFQNISVI